MTETEIKRQITDGLTADGIWWERMNSGDTFGSYKGKNWRIVGCRPGTADLLAAPMRYVYVRDGHMGLCSGLQPFFLWIEVKKPKEKQSPDQVEFENLVRKKGMLYIVASSYAEVSAYISTL